MRTLLVALSHPDDEIGCAGTIARHVRRGDRVVLLWLTRGEMTAALGSHAPEEVARMRTAHGVEAARILGAEPRFLDLPDTRVQHTPDAARDVARVLAEIGPDAVLTWGDAWTRGPRHPDHQATGRIVRDAITLARIAAVVAPLSPHRRPAPVFTIRDLHSTLPELAVDVAPVLGQVLELARFYRERIGWPEESWLRHRLGAAGRKRGSPAVELFEAWETEGGLRDALF